MAPGRVVVGFAAIHDMYARRFAEATIERKGSLSVLLDDVRSIGQGYALARGGYRLSSSEGTPLDEPAGVFSLVLRDFESGWRIIADHTF